MTHRVSVTAEAQRQVEHQTKWYIDHYAASYASKWLTGLEEAYYSLTENPLRYDVAPENPYFAAEVRQMLYGTGRNQFRVLYTVSGNTVEILHVRHAMRLWLHEEEPNQ